MPRSRGSIALARRHGIRLRQSYLRIAKRAAMMAGRYAHAKQFQPASPPVAPPAHFGSGGSSRHPRKIAGKTDSRRCLNGRSRAPTRSVLSSSASAAGAVFLPRSRGRVHWQGKAAHPTSSASRPRSLPPMPARQAASSLLHAKTLPGNPYDGHTLGVVIEDTERLTAARSSVPMSTRDIVGTARPIRAASSSLAKARRLRVIKRELRTPLRHRGRDRTHEDRRSLAAAISRAAKAMRQRHPHRRRPQPPTCTGLAQGSLSPNLCSRSCRLSQPGQHSNRLLNGRLVTFPRRRPKLDEGNTAISRRFERGRL